LTNFEIYSDEPEALAAFYRELLGWRIERAEGVDYGASRSTLTRRLSRPGGSRADRRSLKRDG
jgi:predicted enzyme related to lactoylglutathione lyase